MPHNIIFMKMGLKLNIEQFEKLVKERTSDKKEDATIEEFRQWAHP